jgi:hypothetical protein
MPPRHLKSDTISIAFPAWVFGHDPTKQLLSVTYAQDLSDNLARRSRTLMTSPSRGQCRNRSGGPGGPDGYTLLLVNDSHAMDTTLYERLNFNFIHDIRPIASIARAPNVMEVNPSVPVQSVSEFITFAKTHAGKINMASGDSGTPSHVSGELFKMMTACNWFTYLTAAKHLH